MAVVALAAAGLVFAGVLVLGGRVSDPFGRGEHSDGGTLGGAPGEGGADSGGHAGAILAQAASYEAPPGQPPVTNLKVDRLRDAFNEAAREPRIILSLSPT